ncbi:MAG: transporter substrate-binding domain-containing protein [Eubacterium sp.]|jgi:polar amino acid transport system substrate-binding protein|nr:transporter substrate-binding domain-containing protein [Eubacterium sp.]
MKKLIALSLTMMLSFSIAACGSNADDKPGSGSGTGSAKEEDTASDADASSGAGDTQSSTDAEGQAGSDADSDAAYVKDKGTLVVGITDFEPMDYKDADGSWIGFDADMAAAFAESLGVAVEFVEIDWDNKILELDANNIDCVWNGMTLTDEVKSSMECSNAYCNNAQVVIVPSDKADLYQDVESLSELNFAVEAGSAGEAQAQAHNLSYTPVKQQSGALMEVNAGTSDAAIIDSLMAAAMVGEGTGYENLTYTVGLNNEEYGVGFRKGSDLAAALNEFFAAAYADGSMKECAEKYGVQAALAEQN